MIFTWENFFGNEFTIGTNKFSSGRTAAVLIAFSAVVNLLLHKSNKICPVNLACPTFYETPIIFYSTKEELGHALGKEYRASLAILDENFAKGIIDKIESPLV